MSGLPDPRELLELAESVAVEAAEVARTFRQRGDLDVTSKSTATDLVTEADRAVERLIVDRLHAHRPDDLILGEELGQGQGRGGGVRWVVDPIDGTVNYVYGLPPYAVSIAAQIDGDTVAAVVRNAASGEQWAAVRGGGAWRDGMRLSGSPATDLSRSLIATGFCYDATGRRFQAGVAAAILPLVRDIRRFGAASVDLCFAAEGRVDAYFEQGLNEWDHAAGALIAREAGLLVTGLRGAAPGPRMVVAAPPGLYGQLHDLLVSLNADGALTA